MSSQLNTLGNYNSKYTNNTTQPFSFADETSFNPKAFYLTNDGIAISNATGITEPQQINTLGSQINNIDPMKMAYLKNVNAQTEFYNNQLTQQNSWQNQYMKPALMGVQTLASLGNLWLGFKNYKIAKKQLGLAEEQWGKTKEELNRIKSVRQRITNSYMKG